MPKTRAELPPWTAGAAWLAGGTWLFSEPQPNLRSLTDLATLGWPPFEAAAEHWRIAATCPIAALEAFTPPPHWTAAALFAPCARALLGSFKVRNAATFGGNICLGLPAAPMVALTVALDGSAWIWRHDGGDERLPMRDFVCGPQQNALRPGDLLRAVEVPLQALQRRAGLRRISLTAQGRSAALLIATQEEADGRFGLTITASTVRPLALRLPGPPKREALDRWIADQPAAVWLDDVHVRPAWRRHMTRLLAGELLEEVAR